MSSNPKTIGQSILLFFLAGLCEIGGGYLVWLWLREDFSWILGAVGGFVLFLYAIVPTFQKSHFHRVYAAYGRIFVIASIIWGYWVDKKKPDRFELIGSVIVLVGVAVMFYFPR